LVQRDAQRRSRFWAGVAGSSLVLAAAMIGLALYALDARQESELRRGQAENLIGFMLGDLRQGLQPIGRLDLLDAVGDEAMQYFEALDDNATPRDLLSRSMALRQIGEVRFFQGQLDTSLSAFLESRSVLQRLVAKDEAVDDYLFELGQSEFWVGYVHYERAEFDQALQAMNRYMEISRDLVSRQPGNPDFVTELGYAWSNLGSVADGRGDKAQAISYFREAVSISEGQLVDDPANASLRDDVAGSYSWIGEAEMDLQNLDAADDALSIAFDQYDALAGEEDNVRYLERRASVGALLTELFVKRERYEDAYERASETYEEFAKLIAHDPTNSRWKRQYAMSASDLAKAAYHTERRDLVDELLAESMRHFDELIATDASNQEWQDARREIEVLKQRLQSSMQP
jgi:tetratricopeptide (TPR) repeat protein